MEPSAIIATSLHSAYHQTKTYKLFEKVTDDHMGKKNGFQWVY